MSASRLRRARTLLFVPAMRPELIPKADGVADSTIVDLEDAIAPEHKEIARRHVETWARRGGRGVVRINPPSTPWFDDDIAVVQGTRLAVMLPKADPDSASLTMEALGPDTPVVALVETAAGVLFASETARVSGVARLAFGNVDLAAELGVDPSDHAALRTARSLVVLASAAARIAPPIDGVTTALDEMDVLRSDVEESRRLGFTGKLCVHPAQIPLVDEAFAPTAEQILWAERVVGAFDSKGVGTLDGEMIDRPVVLAARDLLTRQAGVPRRDAGGSTDEL